MRLEQRHSRQPDPRTTLRNADILIVPGRGGSDAGHWQSHFERRHGHARRVHQADWLDTRLDLWAERIAEAADEATRPVLVVAHSFGCLATIRAATRFGAPIAAALLVAPADPARFAIPDAVIRRPLAVTSLVVSSDNDPWLSAEQALQYAQDWGSDYLNLGLVGHINVASGFGDWPAAERLVATLFDSIANTLRLPVPTSARRGAMALAG